MVVFFSIGGTCCSAFQLQSSGRRGLGGPFDWLRCTPAQLVACIADDFERFHIGWRLSTVNDAATTKDAVLNGYGMELLHDFKTIRGELHGMREEGAAWHSVAPLCDWEAEVPFVVSVYQRRIDRFRGVFSRAEPIVLLYTGFPRVSDTLAGDLSLGDVYAILGALRARYPSAHVEIVTLNAAVHPCDNRDGDVTALQCSVVDWGHGVPCAIDAELAHVCARAVKRRESAMMLAAP